MKKFTSRMFTHWAAQRPLLALLMLAGTLLMWPAAFAQAQVLTSVKAQEESQIKPAPVFLTEFDDRTTICLGDSVTLYAIQARNLGFFWTASTGILPAKLQQPGRSFNMITVAPKMTTTYTAVGFGNASASLKIIVETNCCESRWLTAPPIVVPPGSYSGGSSSPFSSNSNPAPPGTVYHVTGDIHLADGAFSFQHTVLMAPNANIFVEDGASLSIENMAVVTAECQEMWGGIYVTSKSYGITNRNGPYSVGPIDEEAYINTCLRHSREGIVMNKGSRTLFRLRGLNLQNCYRGITFNSTSAPAQANEYIVGCTFDSAPRQMKVPFEYQNSYVNYYSEAHLNLVGDVRLADIRNNVFNHALYGVRAYPQVGVQARLKSNTFRDCYLAGMYFDGTSSQGPNALEATTNEFYFPPTIPTTYQINDAIVSADFVTMQWETIGLLALKTPLVAISNRFVRLDSTGMAKYNFPATGFFPQTGIYTDQLTTAISNYFRLLHAGISLTAGQQDPSTLEGNTTLNCDRAVELGDRQGGGAGIVVNNSCNTFARFDDPGLERNGDTYGFYALPNTSVRMKSSIDPSGPIKNLFALDQNGIAGIHFFIYNDSANGSISYDTFDNSPPYGNFKADVQSSSTSNVSVNGVMPYYPSGQGGANGCVTDGYPDAGLQRPALAVGRKVTGRMKPAAPNPVADETVIGYVLPIGTRRAELLVRTGLEGKEVQKISLVVGEQESRLSVRDLPDGLYFCTLLADGLPVQTQRLLVAH